MTKPLNDTIRRVTERVIENSKASRSAYLDLMDREGERQVNRGTMSCSNLAHAYAGAEDDQKGLSKDTRYLSSEKIYQIAKT